MTTLGELSQDPGSRAAPRSLVLLGVSERGATKGQSRASYGDRSIATVLVFSILADCARRIC
jgi:hypothetical protein